MSTSRMADAPQDSTKDFADVSTLVQLLDWRASGQVENAGYTFLIDGESDKVSLTFRELDRRARAIAAHLQSISRTGDRALLLYPSGPDFIAAFFGCVYAGVIGVPTYPPDPARLNRSLPRFQAIAKDARPSVVLTLAGISKLMQRIGIEGMPGVTWVSTDQIASDKAAEWRDPRLNGDHIAFLQYTSGSTALPKGVMVTHNNIISNERMIQKAFRHTEQSTFLGWLPLFHDMGLIGNVLHPLYIGSSCILMSPDAFLQKPLRWLQGITTYRAVTSGGPNFAYDLCVRKISEEQRRELDLSSWRVAFNGAEPVRKDTLDRFSEAFASCGFRREAFQPCYGLAEATLIVSGGREQAPHSSFIASVPTVDKASGSSPDIGAAKEVVSSGELVSEERVAIVDHESSTERPDGAVGEIWVKGPHVAQGYWKRPEETERTFQAYLSDTREGPFLRTGDLGFRKDGELFIAGRMKDLIIVRGRNYYPQDIELTVEQSHRALRPGCCAAFQIELNGEALVGVAQEANITDAADVPAIVERIRTAIAREHELQAHAVLLLKPGSIPKTSSGKIQRQACRAGFLDGSLELVGQWAAGTSVDEDLSIELATTTPETREEMQAWLVSRLASLLRVSPASIDIRQPVSALGLDSLMAVELAHSIESSLGLNLRMTSVLEAGSTAELASALLETSNSSPAMSTRAFSTDVIASAGRKASTSALAHGQRALWFLHKLAPESAAYNIVGAARVVSNIDIDALKRSFQRLVDRHPSLRTIFIEENGTPLQRVLDRMEASFSVDESIQTEASLQKKVFEEAHRPFDLEHGPLMRVSLFGNQDGERILLTGLHHIAADLWSVAVLLQELGHFYKVERAGTRADLPALAFEYSDWVRWQADLLESSEGERLWRYWETQLAGELPVLNLPTDKPRPAIQTYGGATRTIKLGNELTRTIEKMAAANGATVFMSMLAAFQVLLHRYTGQEDLLVGVPTAGRNSAELRDLVGYFVNMVPVRSRPTPATTFVEFLAYVRQAALEAFDHEAYPFNLLVERLQPKRDPSYSPLFQVIFVWLRTHLRADQELASFAVSEAGARMDLGGLTLESIRLNQRIAQFDIAMNMATVNGDIVGLVEYNTDLFEEATIERMLGHFKSLLQSIAANPAQSLRDLAILNDVERRQILVEWNGVNREYPAGVCIHQLFEQQAERSPDRIAAEFDGQSLTYRELNLRANKLAHYLKTLGAGPEVPVGLCLSRSLEMLAGILGIVKTGGAYIPLDPAYPSERLDLMLKDARVHLLLTESRLLAVLGDPKATVICADNPPAAISEQSEANPINTAAGDNPICYLYTSGSTGRPKGVMLRHSSLVIYADTMGRNYQINEGDRVLQFCSISFDISLEEIFPCLTRGGTVVLRTESMLSVPVFIEKCAEFGTTVTSLPTAYWHELATVAAEQRLALPGSLHTIVIAGEKALPEKFVIWRRVAPQRPRLLNTYGPGETTIAVTLFDTSQSLVREGEGAPEIPIGPPIDNAQIYILDSSLSPTPAAVAGELFIGGPLVSRGYCGRADVTAERFVPEPFSGESGARMYRTGDLSRHSPDGNIYFLGRVDHQVKIRGYRVEVEEIEWVLGQHPSVRDNVVVAREDAAGERRLVAYVVVEEKQSVTGSDLRGYLKSKLPDYMVPSWVVMLDGLPLSPNGKVDRRALPAPDWARPDLAASFVAPRNSAEQKLAQLWSEVLGLDRVGIHDDLFELGGHSLLATQLLSRVRNSFQVELPLRALFEAPTVAGLAQAIQAREPQANSSTVLSPRISRREKSIEEQLGELEQISDGDAANILRRGAR